MKDTKALAAVLAALLLAPLAALHAADSKPPSAENLVLVDSGLTPAPILVFKDAPQRTRDAAVTLADYIEKTSGARPQVIDGEPKITPERAIWVGFQPVLKTLFPKLDFKFQHPEEILIAANARHLVIAGRDRWDPQHMEAQGRLAKITGRQQEYGTVNAVYTFLQDKMGVRWLWPDKTGEDIVPQKRIAFVPFEFRYHPQIRARGGMFVKLSLGDSKEGPQQLWARYQRVQLDSLILGGGHGFGDWWEKYHEKHPDYFALQPDGTRSGYPSPNNAKLCDSNPAVWDQWLAEVEEDLKADPTQRVFNASPNDGWASGHCVCERCRAWDHPQGEIVTYNWKGHKEDRPAITDRHVTFANTLARMLKNRFPDKPLYVQLHAYGLSRPAPVAAVPDDNVIISSVANFHLRGQGEGEDRAKHVQQYADWARKAPNLAWRPNLGNPVGLSWGMPDVAMTQAAEDFRFVADNHCIGLYFDLFWNHWATQGPHYYILAQLAWNPRLDAQAVMDDYYQRGFGPAAAELKAYWTLMEQTRMEFIKEVSHEHRRFDIPRKYTPEFLAQAKALLDQADAKLASAPEIHRQRVAFVRCGLDYTRLVADTRSWMQELEKSKGKDTEAIAKVNANWDTAAKMKETFPPHAINWNRVFSQTSAKHFMGLHPDNPLSGRTLQEAQKAGLE